MKALADLEEQGVEITFELAGTLGGSVEAAECQASWNRGLRRMRLSGAFD